MVARGSYTDCHILGDNKTALDVSITSTHRQLRWSHGT